MLGPLPFLSLLEFCSLSNQLILLLTLLFSQLVNAPSSAVAAPAAKTKVPQAEATGNDDGGIDDDLQARLDNLRRM